MASSSGLSKKALSIVLFVMLLALAVSNVLLIRQNLAMRAALDKFQPKFLKAGDRARAFSASGINGEAFNVNYTGKEPERVLLYFTPTCPYCLEQFPFWREMLNKIDKSRFQVMGVVKESEDKSKVNDYLQSVGVSKDAGNAVPVAFVSDEVRHDYMLSMTPITLVIAADGTVQQAWVGKWNPETANQASAALGVDFASVNKSSEVADNSSACQQQ